MGDDGFLHLVLGARIRGQRTIRLFLSRPLRPVCFRYTGSKMSVELAQIGINCQSRRFGGVMPIARSMNPSSTILRYAQIQCRNAESHQSRPVGSLPRRDALLQCWALNRQVGRSRGKERAPLADVSRLPIEESLREPKQGRFARGKRMPTGGPSYPGNGQTKRFT